MKGMGFSRVVLQACLLLALTILLGCGGDGGGSSNNSSGDNNPVLAPSTVAGQTLTLAAASTRQITFDPAGNIWTENGAARGGTYQYTPSGRSAELILSESGLNSSIQLTFSSADSGAYLAGSEQGTFQLQPNDDSPENPNPPDGGAGEGLAPASLDGRTMYGTRTFTSTGPNGQTHLYTFSGDSFHDSDPPEESDGKFVYQPSGNRAALTLNYTAPRVFDGDRHELDMTFSTATTGTFQSIYTRRDGTMIQINGTFQIE